MRLFDQLKSPSDMVNGIFRGVLLSEVTCLRCGSVSSTRDPFLDLSLDFPERIQVPSTTAPSGQRRAPTDAVESAAECKLSGVSRTQPPSQQTRSGCGADRPCG